MDEDTEVKEDEVKDTNTELARWTPEQEALTGIYQCAYDSAQATRKIALFVDRIDWYLELLYYGIIGSLIGWAMVQIFKLLKIW